MVVTSSGFYYGSDQSVLNGDSHNPLLWLISFLEQLTELQQTLRFTLLGCYKGYRWRGSYVELWKKVHSFHAVSKTYTRPTIWKPSKPCLLGDFILWTFYYIDMIAYRCNGETQQGWYIQSLLGLSEQHSFFQGTVWKLFGMKRVVWPSLT